MTPRNPLALVPQYFGCLIFDRRTSRYLPFDHEATGLLGALCREPIDAVLGRVPEGDRDAVAGFIGCFYERGFFALDGRLAADVLDVDVPADHLVGPLAVHLEVVAACNLACTHCFAGVLPRNHHPLTLRELDGLFGDLAGLGSFRLGLTGGEPLLRKDLFDILDAATDHGLHPCLTTNGLLITEDVAHRLGRRELVWLNVSLEGPDAETNDAVRGPGTFDAVLDRLAVMRQHARFTLAFTVMRTNAHLVRRCAELAYRVGAHTAVFRPLYPAGTALHHLDLMPTLGQYTDALHELAGMDSPGADLRGLDPFSPASRAVTQPQVHTSPTCGAGNHVCSISVQGQVSPCSFLGPTFNAGNVRDTPFPVIWRTAPQLERMRRPAGDFAGGCRARAQAFAGSVDAADPWFEEYRQQSRAGGTAVHPGANIELGVRTVSLPVLPSWERA
jgi:MoaA/NifB/PqqE/SkfB family radical SAM enzyme